MIKYNILLSFIILMSLLLLNGCNDSGDSPVDPINPEEPEEPEIPAPNPKDTYYPEGIWNVQQGNDYQNSASQFNVYRMKETQNLVAFWEAGFGDSPSTVADSKYRFQLDDLMEESEKMYEFYRDTLKFVEKGSSLTDKYRMNFYVYYSDAGTVYGGGADNKIGAMWLTPGRIQTKPYGAMAHEMGHAFQYMVACDGHWGYSSAPAGSNIQSIFEMTSQYMLFQYYPTWMQFESYHVDNYLLNTHKTFLHEDIMYDNPFVLEYWSDKHGRDFVGKLWNEAIDGEDPVMTYKRITGINQSAFNDEMVDAAMKFITWDMDRIREHAKDFANKYISELNLIGNGWYRIASSKCPQNYGFNAIRLKVPATGKEVGLHFRGLTGAEGYHAVNVDKAGWRYAFLAEKSNGEKVYGDIYSGVTGEVTFSVPDNTTNLWLVVSGAPAEHWEHICDNDSSNDEQWPYEIKLSNTELY
ncbi:DUF6055 domain-containing protein [uncultured Draconibacterium sp.]|uniref:DUF6055 domain-containing protein n=1 Tax=uncultured Draconibacterium sp. TaxID=1573823 RepID=UPI002AA73242|nr:DUF6055 domain-containing protein [uncultured Draconibacterium sp.]